MSKGRQSEVAKSIDPLDYVRKRLRGIQDALAKLRQCPRTDCSAWLRGQIKHFEREEAELLAVLGGLANAIPRE